MEVFKIYGDQDYWSISYEDNLDLHIEEKLDLAMTGISVIKEWEKADVKIVFRGPKRRIKPDIIDFGGTVGFAITSHAKDILEHLLVPYCESLPLDLNGEEIYFVNPITIIDCIDYDNSVIEVRPPINRKNFLKYALKKEIEYPPIFRIKDEDYSIFITDKFVQALTENHLVGYEIMKIWNSEE